MAPFDISPARPTHDDKGHSQLGVLLRPLGVGDLVEIERHLLALDVMDRHARFGSSLADRVVAAYARSIDPVQAVLFGAMEEPGGRILGLAEVQPT